MHWRSAAHLHAQVQLGIGAISTFQLAESRATRQANTAQSIGDQLQLRVHNCNRVGAVSSLQLAQKQSDETGTYCSRHCALC